MKLFYSILICDMASNLIAIDKLHLTEMKDFNNFNAFPNFEAKFHMLNSNTDQNKTI